MKSHATCSSGSKNADPRCEKWPHGHEPCSLCGYQALGKYFRSTPEKDVRLQVSNSLSANATMRRTILLSNFATDASVVAGAAATAA